MNFWPPAAVLHGLHGCAQIRIIGITTPHERAKRALHAEREVIAARLIGSRVTKSEGFSRHRIGIAKQEWNIGNVRGAPDGFKRFRHVGPGKIVSEDFFLQRAGGTYSTHFSVNSRSHSGRSLPDSCY